MALYPYISNIKNTLKSVEAEEICPCIAYKSKNIDLNDSRLIPYERILVGERGSITSGGKQFWQPVKRFSQD